MGIGKMLRCICDKVLGKRCLMSGKTPSAVLRSSCDIKARIFRQLFVENPRNSLLLLWFSPRFDEKSIVFISHNLRATLH